MSVKTDLGSIVMVCAAAYLPVVNLTAFCMYGADKAKAKGGKWRISESALLTVAVIGGSIGAILGMRVFHHKTKKKKFYLGLPAILAVQVLAAAAWIILGAV